MKYKEGDVVTLKSDTTYKMTIRRAIDRVNSDGKEIGQYLDCSWINKSGKLICNRLTSNMVYRDESIILSPEDTRKELIEKIRSILQ